MSTLQRELTRLARQAGGSYKTVHDRTGMARRFVQHLRALNIQSRSVEQIKARHIESYIEARKAEGVSARSLQNEMAAIRTVLHQAGRDRLAEDHRLSNASLGLSGASRAGTKDPLPDTVFGRVYQNALVRDAGLAATLQLQRLLGLRAQEAVQAAQSLDTWRHELDAGKSRLTITFGTKGGRLRETSVIYPQQVNAAIDTARQIAAQRHGRLIDRPALKTAMDYYHYHLRQLGLTGRQASQSLRYAWAQDSLIWHRQQGAGHKEALARVAMDLGHGDGRGEFVKRVYVQQSAGGKS